MDIFPPHWPLAKMTLDLKFGVQRLDRLIAGYLMELIATQQDPDQCRKSISSFAKTLTVRVAMYLAKLIASLFRPVLYHPCMTLTDDDTESLHRSFGSDRYMKNFCMLRQGSTCPLLQNSRHQLPILSRLPHIKIQITGQYEFAPAPR